MTNDLICVFRNTVLVAALGLGIHIADAHDFSAALIAPQEVPTASVPIEAVSGTVKSFVVDDRVTGQSTRYVALGLDDGRNMGLKGSGLETLSNGARVQATGQRS